MWRLNAANCHCRVCPMKYGQRAYRNGIQLKLMEAGKPTQNAYIESFNCRFRDECLNDPWFTSLTEARIRISA